MGTEQMKSAEEALTQWLSHPQELGKAPAKMECAGSFELHDLKYYMFKYKKNFLGKWLLGVCGGYEGDSLEHCGYVFSEMKEYKEATAVEDANAMVEMLRAYWMEQAKKAEEHKKNAGTFVGFALLSENRWNKQQLVSDLKDDWDLEAVEDSEKTDDTLVFAVGDMTAAISLMPAPVPDGEAEKNAVNNYMWPEAVETAKEHKAHILVAVLGDNPLIERGKLFTKLLACCCRQENTTGVYTSGTVFEPRFYEDFAGMMKEGELPIFNWIWFGLYQRKGGVCCYTYGLHTFGKDEMEVLDAVGEPSDVREFLSDLTAYVLEYDVTLNDGETIGFSEDDKHSITRSEGVSLPEMTLKISYDNTFQGISKIKRENRH